MRRITVLAAAAVLATVGLAAPAQASSTSGGCSKGSVCLFDTKGNMPCATPNTTWRVCKNITSAWNRGYAEPGKDQVSLYDKNGNFIICIRRGDWDDLSRTRTVHVIKWGRWSNC
ncbi:hypothetical protein [Streptosporangium sp. KLBMP 9127]|nr:hypothetical protein [Streptosporangium sp. KLBMP 9127]